VNRLRGASRAPLAVAGILAVPLFFVGLMAFSLKLDKPSVAGVRLADPTKSTVGTIYLAAFAVAGGLVLVGLLAMLLRSRLAAAIPAVAAIVAAIVLIVPLGTWAAQHTNRYPLGVDNIKKSDPSDIYLRGEWEASAKTTARQIGFATIGIAVAAIAILAALEVRRRRGREPMLVEPPPPGLETGGAAPFTGA
jgi:4-amino-4-deoxy-L-arabinose transferase-like glycosyltransferase